MTTTPSGAHNESVVWKKTWHNFCKSVRNIGQKKNTRIWLNTNYNEEEIKVNHLEKWNI